MSDIRQARQASQEDPPEIERINSSETYLLDEDGTRIKRICGVQRAHMPKGFVCVNAAGVGTSHPGAGYCHKHDKKYSRNTPTTWETMNKALGLPNNLREVFEAAEDIEEIHLKSVDSEIRMLYSMQALIMKKATARSEKASKKGQELEVVLTNEEVKLLNNTISDLTKVKQAKHNLEREAALDTTSVKEFITQIFKVVLANSSRPIAERILTQVMDEVVAPFQSQGRIKGGGFNFDSSNIEQNTHKND